MKHITIKFFLILYAITFVLSVFWCWFLSKFFPSFQPYIWSIISILMFALLNSLFGFFQIRQWNVDDERAKQLESLDDNYLLLSEKYLRELFDDTKFIIDQCEEKIKDFDRLDLPQAKIKYQLFINTCKKSLEIYSAMLVFGSGKYELLNDIPGQSIEELQTKNN